jgi:hypothetical protein
LPRRLLVLRALSSSLSLGESDIELLEFRRRFNGRGGLFDVISSLLACLLLGGGDLERFVDMDETDDAEAELGV